MDSEEEKEFQKKLEENFENTIQRLFDKDSIAGWSLLTRILFYIFFTLSIFIGALFSIVKKIIFIRFSQIPIEFKMMVFMDGILRKYLTI
jgi:hypothetical protein